MKKILTSNGKPLIQDGKVFLSDGGGGATITTKGGWQGTTVPTSGMVEKIYLNTNLSIDEVVDICSSLNFVEMDGAEIWACFTDETMENVLIAMIKMSASETGLPDDIYMIITSQGFIFQTYDINDYGFTGWKPDYTGVEEINIENQLSVLAPMINFTPENDKANGLFSITPFIMYEGEPIELSGEYQESLIEIEKNGTTNIKEMVITNKEIPLKIKTNVPIPEGYIKPNLTLTITENGEYEVSQCKKVIAKIINNNEDLLLTSGLKTYENNSITRLRSYALAAYNGLTQVSFPKVTTIGSSSFYVNRSINSVSFPEATRIDNLAFSQCTNLVTTYFPKVRSIGASAFHTCESLVSLRFPLCERIEGHTFYDCEALTDIYFGYNGVVDIMNNDNLTFSAVSVGVKIHVRSEYASQYESNSKWINYISNGRVVIVGDYTD